MDKTQIILSMYKNNISIKKTAVIAETTQLEVYECLYRNGFSHLKDRNQGRDKKVCELYIEGEQITQIAKQLHINRHTVTDILNAAGIYKGNKHADMFSGEKSKRNQKAVSLYQEGKSLREVSETLKICPSTVSSVLHSYGIDTRPQHAKGHSKGATKNRKHVFDLNFFEKIDTEAKAYWLGFLYADGYVGYKGIVIIGLKESDYQQLENFRSAISNDTIPIKYNKLTKSYAMTACSVKMAEDLVHKGCMQKKSLKLTFPSKEQTPEHLLHHFMRGYFDGDGCISNIKAYSPQFSVLGTPEFLDRYEEELLKNMNNTKKNKRIHSDSWNAQTEAISYAGVKKMINIYHFLYKDATIYLQRKKERFEELERRLEISLQKSQDD